MNISLCMIVKNEQKSLGRCLNSVKDLVQEMVIVDTGSTDSTLEIIQEFDAHIYHFSWCNDFAVARNYGMQYATQDWILCLDADEVLTPTIIPEIKSLIKLEKHLVINFLRQEVGATQSPYSLVSRLFRRHPQVYFSRPYHAMIDDSVSELLNQDPSWQVLELSKVGIYHYGYQPQAIASLDKSTRARQTMEKFYQTHPEDAYVCSKLGALYLQVGEHEPGMELLQKALNLATTPQVLYEIHYHLANAYTRTEAIIPALDHYQQALEQPITPKLKLGAYNNLAGLMQTLGDLATAQEIYTEVISIDPQFYLGYYNLGLVLKQMRDYSGAIAAYQQALQLNPDYAYTHQNLGVVYWKTGMLDESFHAFQQAIALHQAQNNLQEAQRLQQTIQSFY